MSLPSVQYVCTFYQWPLSNRSKGVLTVFVDGASRQHQESAVLVCTSAHLHKELLPLSLRVRQPVSLLSIVHPCALDIGGTPHLHKLAAFSTTKVPHALHILQAGNRSRECHTEVTWMPRGCHEEVTWMSHVHTAVIQGSYECQVDVT